MLPPDAGERHVANYRAYKVGLDGHFVGFEPLVCADDTDATEMAQQMVDGHDIEVWSGPRLVVRLERGFSADEVDAAMDRIVDEGARPKHSRE